jgi:hypothetical protein
MDRQLEEIIDSYESASAFGEHAVRDADGDAGHAADSATVTSGRFGRGSRPSYWERLWSAS